MQKKRADSGTSKKEIFLKTDLTFDELMKKAVNTPLPKKAKKSKKK